MENSLPSSIVFGALGPAISVRTHPGQHCIRKYNMIIKHDQLVLICEALLGVFRIHNIWLVDEQDTGYLGEN